MTIKYNIVERGNPADPDAPKKFYPSIQSSGRRDLRHVSERLGEVSMVRRSDVLAMIDAMLRVIPKELADGYIVDLGDFGSFWLSINSEGQESADEVRPHHITNAQVRFKPGPEFKEVMEKIKYAKVNAAVPAPAESSPGPGTVPEQLPGSAPVGGPPAD